MLASEINSKPRLNQNTVFFPAHQALWSTKYSEINYFSFWCPEERPSSSADFILFPHSAQCSTMAQFTQIQWTRSFWTPEGVTGVFKWRSSLLQALALPFSKQELSRTYDIVTFRLGYKNNQP